MSKSRSDDGAAALVAPALASSEVAIAVLAQPGLTIAYANPACLTLFGWQQGSAVPTRPEPAQVVRDAATTVLRNGEPLRVGEVAVGDRFVHIVCSPIGENSTVSGVSVMAIDVTAQVRAHRHSEGQRLRLRVLDEATTAITAETDPRRELMALADSVVPALADACAIYLVDHTPSASPVSTRTLHATRLVCVIDPTLGVPPPAPEVRLRLAPTRPMSRAAQSGRAVFATGPQADPSDWGEPWLTQLDPHSHVAVPIGTTGAVRAVISFAAVGKRPPYEESDIALMREISARVDTAVAHALRLQHTSEVSLTLQRGLLAEPPEVDGLDIRVRYRPAGPGLEVGGDWYDAFVLPAGGVALTVGDVVGHDLSAANTMGQLRSMVQALACQPGAEPGGVVSKLNRLSRHLRVGELATVIHGRITAPGDGGPATFTWANAGHPAPLLVGPGASARVLAQPPSPLLGLVEAEYEQVSVTIPAGAVLLLYTDGLMEDPAHPSADAINELADAAGQHITAGIDALCDRLIAAAPTRDDIALLAVTPRP